MSPSAPSDDPKPMALVVHDLRNSLTIMQGRLRLAVRLVALLPPEHQDGLTSNLLDISGAMDTMTRRLEEAEASAVPPPATPDR